MHLCSAWPSHSVLLVLASVVVFVVYVTATMRLLQVSWVVTAVAEETRRVLGRERPGAASYLSAAAPQIDRDPRLVRLKAERDDGRGGQFGVLGVDRGRWQLAQKYHCLLQFLPKVGEYVPIGAALVAVHGAEGLTDDAVRGCVHSVDHARCSGSPVRNPPTRRCCQPGAVAGDQPADYSCNRHRPSRRS